jgi:tRNA A-37 threonylcarbamoyl transferase component Bud32
MSEPTAPGDPLDQVIANYLQAAEAGKVPSRQALLDAHPEFAADLRAFFADYDRLDNRADALKLAASRPPAERPKVKYFGDYELLEEIAEGGMGLVYKARQSSLGRTVALKLVRAGRLAKPIDIARFRIEAEAAAGLDHPNIVPLYEVGEHEGQHYLAMKFVDGPPLARLPRGSVRAEVERLEAVARAVDFAHRQGILHRDLKPSNILTDAAGTPFVTDFGLAKRIDAELSLTESGQMLGTAGYVAPEQALGKKGLTVTADVFSLGAVLFERLTGTPAFPGGTILERLRSLHESITPRPTLLMPHLPRDLETVCLKCLEGEPAKRYPSAGALADDLARWLRGEPIVARRVTQLERFWLWCRRNPAVAGLGTAILALLLTVAVVASYAAVELQKRAIAAEQARDRAERSQIEGLLRPLGYDDKIGPAECIAFNDLAALREDRLRMRFLDAALEDPTSALRIAGRSERVAQSVVGASDRRRQLALAFLSARQRDASADSRIRFAACAIALELGATDLTAVEQALRWAAENALGSDPLGYVPFPDVDRLTDEQVRVLHPISLSILPNARPPAADAWAPSFGDLERGGYAYWPASLAARLAARLDSQTANRTWDRLVSEINKADSVYDAPSETPECLAVVARALDGPAAIRAANDLAGWLNTYSQRRLCVACQGLEALAPRLDSPAAIRVADALVGVLDKAEPHWLLGHVCNSFAILAPRLDTAAATRVSDALLPGLRRSGGTITRKSVLASLTALAPRVDGSAALRALDALVDEFNRAGSVRSPAEEVHAVAALAARVNAPTAYRIFKALIHAKPGLQFRHDQENTALRALAARMDARDAARESVLLVDLLTKREESDRWDAAGNGLAALAERLDLPTAQGSLDALLQIVATTKDSRALEGTRVGLAALAARIGPAAAIRASDAFAGTAERLTEPAALAEVCATLGALAPNLGAAAADRALGALAGILGKTADETVHQVAGTALAQVCQRLDASGVRRAIGILLPLLGKADNDGITRAALAGMAALAPRLDAATAVRASNRLAQALNWTLDENTLAEVAGRLAELAPNVDLATAARITESVVARMEKVGDANYLESARRVIMALSEKIGTAERDALRARMAKAVVAGLQQLRDALQHYQGWDELCFIADQFHSAIERSIAAGDLTIDDIAHFNQAPFAVKKTLVTFTTDLATIADCLRHPACVGEVRQAVLHRLEELAFPPSAADARQAVAESVVTGLAQPLAGGVLAAGRQVKWERGRTFRTTWDAVAWLREHHPEIDLDKPYTPRR